MRYTETRTYVSHMAALRTERATLKKELADLGELARGTRTPEQQRRTNAAKNRLKTVEKNLTGLHDMSTFTWKDLFQLLVEADECEWNAAQLALMQGDMATYEGRGEKSLRHRFGLPLEVSQDVCDFPDDGEGKYLGDKLETFRLGKVGKQAYGRVYRTIVRQFKDECLTPDLWDTLTDGEVSTGKVYHELPLLLRTLLQEALAPAVVLSSYQTMFLMSDFGFIRVPRCDFAAAFQLSAVTQMSPKYRLRRDYVERRLRSHNVAVAA
jgi:hypothetical protein